MTPLTIGASPRDRLLVPSLAGRLTLASPGGQVTLAARDIEADAFLNGAPVTPGPVALEEGDCLLVAPGLLLTVRGQPEVVVRVPALESALASDPADDPRWAVYADALESGGDSLLPWLRGWRAERLPGPLRPVAHALDRGLLVRWTARGWLSRVAVQPHGEGPVDWLWTLARLAGLPVGRLVTRVDLSLGAGAALASEVEEALRLLASARFAPVLRRLTVDPQVAAAPWFDAQVEVLRRSCRALDASEPSARPLEARLEVLALPSGVRLAPAAGAEVVRLRHDGATVGVHPRATLRLLGDQLPEVVCQLVQPRPGDGRWEVHIPGADALQGGPTARLNGAPVAHQRLLDGDVLEPWPGVRLRFLAGQATDGGLTASGAG